MKPTKISSVLLSVVLSISMVMTPFEVAADGFTLSEDKSVLTITG